MTDEQLERAMRIAAIDDDGFSARVLAALPLPTDKWSLTDWQTPFAGAAVASAALLQIVPRLSDLLPHFVVLAVCGLVALTAASVTSAMND